MRALRIALRAGNIPGQSGVIRRPGFVDPLVHGGDFVLRRLHLRMILQCQRLGIVQIQLYRRSRLRQNTARGTQYEEECDREMSHKGSPEMVMLAADSVRAASCRTPASRRRGR